MRTPNAVSALSADNNVSRGAPAREGRLAPSAMTIMARSNSRHKNEMNVYCAARANG
jgi:hypothetical protein